MLKVRENFLYYVFHVEFKIGLINYKHIWIHLMHGDNYSRLLMKPSSILRVVQCIY